MVHTKDDKILLSWIRLELIVWMSQVPNSIGEISNATNSTQISSSPKKKEPPESPGLDSLHGSNISISSTELLLQFALVKKNSGARSRTCEQLRLWRLRREASASSIGRSEANWWGREPHHCSGRCRHAPDGERDRSARRGELMNLLLSSSDKGELIL